MGTQLSDLSSQPISADPKTGLRRVMDIDQFIFNRKAKRCTLTCTIYRLDVNGVQIGDENSVLCNPSNPNNPYRVDLFADNSSIMSATTGNYLMTRTEYDQLGEDYTTALANYEQQVAEGVEGLTAPVNAQPASIVGQWDALIAIGNAGPVDFFGLMLSLAEGCDPLGEFNL